MHINGKSDDLRSGLDHIITHLNLHIQQSGLEGTGFVLTIPYLTTGAFLKVHDLAQLRLQVHTQNGCCADLCRAMRGSWFLCWGSVIPSVWRIEILKNTHRTFCLGYNTKRLARQGGNKML
jgi:hypothetical protein